MKLEEALDKIESLTEEQVVFARRPWRLDSEALIGRLDQNLRVPKPIADQGFAYFIDAPVAKEVLGVFGSRQASPQERRDLLLYYAEHDAYPSWVYDS
jgi:hypothetical protein